MFPPPNPNYPPTVNYTSVTSGETIDSIVAQTSHAGNAVPQTTPVTMPSTPTAGASSSYAPLDLNTAIKTNSVETYINNMDRDREAGQLQMQQTLQREQDYFVNYNRQRQKEDMETAIRDDQIRKEVDSFEFARQMSAAGYETSNSPGYNSYNSGTGANPNDVQVNGYSRRNGTYAAPYHRSAPNSTRADNYSTAPNTNPYTGRTGTRH